MTPNFLRPGFSHAPTQALSEPPTQTLSRSHKPLIYILAPNQAIDHIRVLYGEALQGKEKVQISRAAIDLKKAIDCFTFVGGGFIHSLPILAATGMPIMLTSTLWVAASLFNQEHQEIEVQRFSEKRNRDAHSLLLSLNESKSYFKHWNESMIEEVDITNLSAETKFPPGYPWIGKLYRQHPLKVKSNYYYPVDSYYSMLLDERERELVQLSSDLGAKKIWIRDESEEKTLNEKPRVFEFPDKPLSSNAAFDESRYVWLEHETTWQTLVNARLHRGCTSASFELSTDISQTLFSLLERIEGLLSQMGSTESIDLKTLMNRTIYRRRVYIKFA